ncbi:MAG: undecaprenyl/decaprenyl-phosphate alpha-N-acetylglucosaminyl 1-phosphate transferase [Planctomycetes bacterium]|nr:undecaprenyl/decaprenyl-phosphate alpha-N-acetylglucosaminyl 1-phosphate transferase [Planctomycetota bacterium]
MFGLRRREHPMALLAVAIFIGAFVVSVIVTGLMRRFAPHFGLVDEPGERKVHTRTTPLGGGLGIFLGMALPVAAGILTAWAVHAGWRPDWLPKEVLDEYGRVLGKGYVLALIFGGALLIVVTGLFDDVKGLGPWLKLFVEVVVAVALIACNISISIFIENHWLCALVTLVWVVGITNAFNLLDNMDGLSGGVAFIVSAIFLVVAAQTHQFFIAALLLTLMGALAGFLVFNFPPASIFMGDSGSLFIGYMLAVLSVLFTFYQESHALFPVVVPLLILAVPLFDTISVIIIRLGAGKSPFVGDKNHFSHRLVALGMTPRETVLTIYLVTFCLGITATLLYQVNEMGAAIVFVQAFAILCVILLLERAGRRKPP